MPYEISPPALELYVAAMRNEPRTTIIFVETVVASATFGMNAPPRIGLCSSNVGVDYLSWVNAFPRRNSRASAGMLYLR
jgi:hypothetical protein